MAPHKNDIHEIMKKFQDEWVKPTTDHLMKMIAEEHMKDQKYAEAGRTRVKPSLSNRCSSMEEEIRKIRELEMERHKNLSQPLILNNDDCHIGQTFFSTEGDKLYVFDGTGWQPQELVKEFDMSTINIVEDPVNPDCRIQESEEDKFDRAMKGVL